MSIDKKTLLSEVTPSATVSERGTAPKEAKVTIRQMLDGVKEHKGDFYINQNISDTGAAPEEGGGSFLQSGEAAGLRGYVDLPSRIPMAAGSPNGVKITLTKDADVTTALHELGYVFLWLMDQRAIKFPDNALMDAYSEAIFDDLPVGISSPDAKLRADGIL